MEDEYIKGQEMGRIIQGLKDLGRNVDNGFKAVREDFKNLDCSDNKEKLTILYEDYIDRKETRKFIFRAAVKKFFPLLLKSGSIIGVIAGTVYACIT